MLAGALAEAEAARAAAEARAAEEAHRGRNLLALVTALLRRAIAEGSDPQALATLPARLAASLEPGRGGTDELGAIAAATLDGFRASGARAEVAGPAVRLSPLAARRLALVLFELATNAVKHGAWSVTGGTVRLEWTRDASGTLRLAWREQDGPGFSETAAAGGGARLLAAFRRDCGAAVRRVETAREMRLEIEVPASQVQEARPGLRVLVVEDNVLIAADLAELLSEAGCGEVVVALDLAEARAALATGPFDRVFLDVSLGRDRSDGLLALTGSAAVTIVSGLAREDLPAALQGLPLLGKPFGPAEVAAAVGEEG
jgi:two-component sensor histidine kinase/CheY-like chemotaxis protein